MAALMAQLAVQLATGGTSPDSFVSERVIRCWHLMEHRLGEAPCFGGESLTVAGVMMVHYLTTPHALRGTSIHDRPNLLAYLGRIGARPADRRAMAECEPGWQPMLT